MLYNVIQLLYGYLPNSASTYVAGASRLVFLFFEYGYAEHRFGVFYSKLYFYDTRKQL